MSYGMTPYEFVQQVFYCQEKVRLDFRPDDDKYKEVLMEANLVLQELQKEEDWTWLRERVILGRIDNTKKGVIPEFELPDWVYKVSTLHDDCVRLYKIRPHCDCESCRDDYDIDELDYICVPWVSTGRLNGGSLRQNLGPMTNIPRIALGAVTLGNTVTFTRPLFHGERYHRAAVCDVQARIPLLHICDDDCPRDKDGNCTLIEDRVFTEIPDPNYVVWRTAALHAEGSPPAQGRIATMTDTAQKLLSAMRQNDASATDADYLDWEVPEFINVI